MHPPPTGEAPGGVLEYCRAHVFFFRSALSAEIALTDPKSTLAVTWMGGTLYPPEPPEPPLLLLLLLSAKGDLRPPFPEQDWWHCEQYPCDDPPEPGLHPLLLLLLLLDDMLLLVLFTLSFDFEHNLHWLSSGVD